MTAGGLESFDPARLRQRQEPPTRPAPVVIIGAGGIVVDAHLPAYRSLGLEVIGVHDVDVERARSTAARFSLPRAFETLAAAIEAGARAGATFDIAVPPDRLFDVLTQIPAGAAVLMQKPMGTDLFDATRIRALCRKRRLIAAVNFQLRFAPMMLALADLVASGLLGRLVELEFHVNVHMPWEMWPFLETLPRMELALHSVHYLDLSRALLGEPRGVYARTVKHPRAPRLASSRSSVILDHGPDVRACFSVNHHHAFGPRHQDSSLRVEGERGAAIATLGVNLDYPRGRPDRLEVCFAGGEWREVPLAGNWFPDAFRGPICNLQRFAHGEDRALVSGVEDAWKTMALVEACYASDAHGATALPKDADPPHDGHETHEER